MFVLACGGLEHRRSSHLIKSAAAGACLHEFNFEKSKFMSIDIDHVVAHARRSAVGRAGDQLYVARTLRFDEAQRTARKRYDYVIERMNVLARFCMRGEGPLGYDHAFVFDLYGRNGFHVCNPLRSGLIQV
jgi:hypothetical protein